MNSPPARPDCPPPGGERRSPEAPRNGCPWVWTVDLKLRNPTGQGRRPSSRDQPDAAHTVANGRWMPRIRATAGSALHPLARIPSSDNSIPASARGDGLPTRQSGSQRPAKFWRRPTPTIAKELRRFFWVRVSSGRSRGLRGISLCCWHGNNGAEMKDRCDGST